MAIAQQVAWFALAFFAMVTACSTAPPRGLIDRNDHGGLAVWYEEEAVRLRGKAEEMRQMAERYAAVSYPFSPKESKTELINHCRHFMAYYGKAAEEAEALAKLHRGQTPAIP